MTAALSDPLEALNVSRETIGRLREFVQLLEKWNPAINLVSRSTLPDAWSRHILDSAQLYALAPTQSLRWLDLGSGGGFPGIVTAIIASELNPNRRTTLVEADQRKAAFLRQACQTFALNAQVISERIEALPPQDAQIITARALAPLERLCGLVKPHMAADGICLFQKGAQHATEISEARRTWHMDFDLFPSITDQDAVILKLKALDHV